ncbi:acetyl-CoA carboxylase biotin carboxylase subunit [Poseidonibacter ostreae]|jgi:acetyl-CoA carboxylase, biotin carboxylase subunit|uniref:Biotin carboxylase n=1 Tax=Poseidonibacter ostreae TaxID=2654171 RepID=A0A6L4WTJ5_9BACT|nr:acetyl-CoA carboxylase biotin carboxylase subunit [Poseidonibacter ostreae]KAB7887726.1 acetyl-CoA carboxylase biotin carboxylase subunit [Poseidonibacter ostreae]KAB7889284.1 acetyl-CoA carboxylase biotin carboxylase subunit [Poseidonibacter ostreae]KAB7892129.1 acetyl-CoA carboxylase biotin carboxylase subunit [Poseidonibacter ostreae]MAD42967.1 acetyl-CoA carboxylase biotin carboxylase subunit [Arcobacter sp.]|tara:strand:+ start:393 stop:1745 length:1353 start_codon:yes stop_codon:yes gene_type:complete
MAEIKKILIANRGEIVQRAIRTIREMGKKSVAVYSAGDKNASYLKHADEAVCIGGVKSIDSYLNIPALITAAEMTGCDAIFPGYGFLSENQDFVEICRLHNIKFIGPSVEVMEKMADKSKAKDEMIKAGVPVVPGSNGAVHSLEEGRKVAEEIGYPIMAKASAGGGGRGMRLVNTAEDFDQLFMAASSEALAAFGDGTMYLERFINNPRHIEVQVIGDSHGNAIHIGERDCSLQRRHQKVIEESPAILLNDETRAHLHDVAVKATKFLKYEGAGTFEFLADDKQNIYFMEMNTRLQVEHPVSEMVSGIDIVELMIKVAQGEELPPQEKIKFRGHAIEVRITAEDPNSFLPSPGKVTQWMVPGGRNVRVDSHLYAGYVVPPYYDSMVGKLIVWGRDRNKAINIMKRALNEFEVEGIRTTIPFHKKMMENEDFISNNYDTKYLENYKSLDDI